MRIGGLAALCGAALLRVVYGPPRLGYDAWYALAWGRELAHGVNPDFSGTLRPTPHPLANVVSSMASVFGARGVTLIAALSVLAFAVLGVATFTIGRRLFGPGAGVLVALIVLTRPLLADEMLFCSVDIPFLALVASAGALLVGTRRREGPALVLLVLAGLLRPEGWLLAAALAALCWWRGTGPARPRLVVASVFAPLAWALFDLLVTGDALHSLHGTQDLAQELGRPHSAATALGAIPDYLRAILGTRAAWAGAVGGLAALWLALDRAALPLAIAALGLLGFLALGVADLPLLYRYMLLPALALVLLTGFGAFSWSVVGAQWPGRWALAVLGLVVVGLVASSAGDDRDALRSTVSANRVVHTAQQDLAKLVGEPVVRRAASRCRRVAVPGPRAVPELSYRLGLAPSHAVVAPGGLSGSEVAFSPASSRVAAVYALTPNDRLTLTASQLRGLTRVARNGSWTAYAGPRCAV